MLLEGLHIPLTTPFHPDGRLALHKLASNVARYSKVPASGLIVLGPSGEPTLLGDDETREVLRTAAQSAAPEKVLIANVSRDSVRTTVALANFAAEQNYDAVLIGAPSIPLSDLELVTYFRTIADHSPLPLVLLSTVTHPLTASQIAQLISHPQIIALMTNQATTDVAACASALRHEVTVTPTFAAVTARMKNAAAASATPSLIAAASLTGAVVPPTPSLSALRTRTRSVGFQIISSCSSTALASINAGAVGIAPAFAASAPQACYEVFAAWKDSDQPLAEEKQSRLIEAARVVEASPAALKYACDRNGYFGGPPRLPYLPLTASRREVLELHLEQLRN